MGMNSADEDSAIPRDVRLGLGLVGHWVDIVLDITLAVQLSEQGEDDFCYVTIVLILFAPFVQTLWDATQLTPLYDNKYKMIYHMVLNMTLLRMTWLTVHIWWSDPNIESSLKRMSHKQLATLRLFECALKSLPQLILQCYILALQERDEATTIRILSILSGIFSVAGTELPPVQR